MASVNEIDPDYNQRAAIAAVDMVVVLSAKLTLMAGIYLHIPFCKKACYYCNFHFSTSLQHLNDFTDALLKEIGMQQQFLDGELIHTIYFGGGTPSLLSSEQLSDIMRAVRSNFEIDELAEISMEVNPDDINAERLAFWKAAGINRLSIGVQSFFDEDLIWMNRAHDAGQAIRSIEMAQDAGFTNLSIDLIYGTPSLTDQKWQQNFERALSLNIPHLSCYALTVEPKTVLAKMIDQERSPDVDPDRQATHFNLLMKWAGAAGYEHYEISNFAKPGFRSRHNSAYWQRKKYLGVGPSAHSYNGSSRQWNVSNNALYIQAIRNEELPFEMEVLSTSEQFNEYVMIGLRTMEGINVQELRNEFGVERAEKLLQLATPFLHQGLAERSDDNLRLTHTGKFFADGISSSLFEA